MYSDSTIQRFYYQGREAVIGLVHRLEDQLEDARAQLISKPESLIAQLRKELQSVKRTLAQKSDELIKERQINYQLRCRVHELERQIESGLPRVERDSHNSSLPPSLDLPWKKVKRTRSLRRKSGLRVGGQFGHSGATLRQVTQPDRIITHTPDACQNCGAPLNNSQPQAIIRRQVFDIKDGRVQVTEHRVETKLCPECRTRTRVAFPASVRAPAQYGSGHGGYIHVARTDELTHYAYDERRGKAAMDEIGILPQFRGTLVRDGFSSYQWYGQCRHSLCNAHLLRDLVFVTEVYPEQEVWTRPLSKLLLKIKRKVAATKTQPEAELTQRAKVDFLRRYDRLVRRADRLNPPPPKGVAISDASKNKSLIRPTPGSLTRRLQRRRDEVLRFMTDRSVPFDNNGSERDLRMVKLQQKISGCFRTPDGARSFCRVRSYLSTARKQGHSLLYSLERVLAGKPLPFQTSELVSAT